MKIYLDTSVLLAAALTRVGPARELFRQARRRRWVLLTSHWCEEEVARNLAHSVRGQAPILVEGPISGPDPLTVLRQKLRYSGVPACSRWAIHR